MVPLNSSSNVHVQLPARPSGVVPWQGRFGLVASVDRCVVLRVPGLPEFPELPEFVAVMSALGVAGVAPTLEPALGVVVLVVFAVRASPRAEDDVVPLPSLPMAGEAFVPAVCRPNEVAAVSFGVAVVVVVLRRAAAVGTPPVAATASAATTSAAAALETSVPARQPRRRGGPSSLGIVFPLPLATALRRHPLGGTSLPFDCA